MLLPSNLLGAYSSTAASIVYANPSSSQQTTGADVQVAFNPVGAAFLLKVNQLSPSSSHTLDVYIRHSVDRGTTYDDFVHFGQVVGKGTGPTLQVAQWVGDYAASSSTAGNFQSVRTTQTQTLAAGLVLQGPIGKTWRAEAVVNGASSSQPWQVLVLADIINMR